MKQCCRLGTQKAGVHGWPSPLHSNASSRRLAASRLCRGQGRTATVITFAAKGGKSTAAKGFGAPKPQTKGIADDAMCPCGSGALYEACCAGYHRGGAASVPSPEALLRSRYSAYVAKDPVYIADTTHPDSPEYIGSRASYIGTVKGTMRRLDPQGLSILAAEPGETADEAFITFRLKRKILAEKPGVAAEIDEVTERSRFVRVRGRWLYMDSEFLPSEEEKAKQEAAATASAAPAQDQPKKQGFKLPFF